MPLPEFSLRAKKRFAVLLSIVGGFLLIGFLFIPRTLTSIAEEELVEILAAEGIEARVKKVHIESSTHARIEELCVQAFPPFEEETFACIDELNVHFTRDGLTSTDIEIISVEINGGFLNLTSELGTLEEIVERTIAHFNDEESSEESNEESGEESHEESGEESHEAVDLPLIEIRNFDVRLNNQTFDGENLPVEQVTIAMFSFDPSESDELQHFSAMIVPDFISQNSMIPAELNTEALDAVTIELWIDENQTPTRLQIIPSTPLVVDLGGFDEKLEGFSLQIGAIGGHWPYTISAERVSLSNAAQREPILSFDELELQVEQWTSDINDLFFAALNVQGLDVHVTVDDEGVPVFQQNSTETNESSPVNQLATANSNNWESRDWWNQIPWFIQLDDASFTLETAESSFEMTDLSLDYALRILGMQLDVELEANIKVGENSSIPLNLEVIWSHGSGKLLSLNVLFDSLELGDLRTIFLPFFPELPIFSGNSSLSLGVIAPERNRTSGNLDINTLLTLNEFSFATSLFQDPVLIPQFEGDFRSTIEPSENGMIFSIQQGDLAINGANASITPTFAGIQLDPPSIAEIEMQIEIPDQSAMQLFEAVPSSIRGPLNGLEMAGSYGLSLSFPIHFSYEEEEEVDPVFEVTIDPPTEIEIRDTTLAMISMPFEVDVNRLNHAFSFTFSSIANPANAPISPRELQISAPPDGPFGRRSSGWAPLENISYYLIATQLYREDGSFFRNQGINWLQLRRVLATAIEERELGRGASTISMQLIKNIFLSHERTIERKLQELFLTYWMTRIVPKARILAIYLNIIEWGRSINGIVEASEYYFGKPPSGLSLSEAIWLSAITPEPLRREHERSTGVSDRSWRRVLRLIDRLEERDFITEEEAARAREDRPRFSLDGSSSDPVEEAYSGGVLPPPSFERNSRIQEAQRIGELQQRTRQVRGSAAAPRVSR